MKLITIKESHYASDLAILKSRLESEGIECYLEGGLTSQVLNHIPSMQAKLKIAEEDLEEAHDILIENGELQTEKIVIACPKCGSKKYIIKRGFREKWKLITSVLLTLITFVPVNNSYRTYTFVCKKCENEFSAL